MRSDGLRWSESHRFANGGEQLDRHPGFLAQLLECRVGEGTPSIVGSRVDEVEGDQVAAESLAEPIEREAGIFQHLNDANPLRASAPEAAVVVGLEDPQVEQAVDVLRIDSCQLCRLVP